MTEPADFVMTQPTWSDEDGAPIYMGHGGMLPPPAKRILFSALVESCPRCPKGGEPFIVRKGVRRGFPAKSFMRHGFGYSVTCPQGHSGSARLEESERPKGGVGPTPPIP